ncbi:hypothetical protein BJ138DRAFT_1109072 [Hygrophoropsis aurantiaca]|uniref:Uncharacterized protein n=1 Tax=Hygrophoropsis aurantiaca TaxID=72124 RepID=A0ACB8AS33_9AGAM|nr:hypothetical protein BJ138DRAFT_1109072 [Hygrophoropsis aurantiaca]
MAENYQRRPFRLSDLVAFVPDFHSMANAIQFTLRISSKTSAVFHNLSNPKVEMSFTTLNTPFTLFPTSPASPNAFAIFTQAQCPRDNYVMYEDLRQVFGSTNGRTAQKKSSSSSLKGGLRKILGSK